MSLNNPRYFEYGIDSICVCSMSVHERIEFIYMINQPVHIYKYVQSHIIIL
jgi:hypothetical protein